MAFLPRRRRDDEYDQFAVDIIPGADPMPALPDLHPTRPMPLPGPGGAPYEARTPPFRQPSRGAEMADARDAYSRMPLSHGRGALKGALRGAIEGLRSGGLGGALGGALGGGLVGGISPKTIRRQEFETQIRPQIEERFQYADAEQAAQRQAEQDALNAEYRQAQIGELNRRSLPRPQRPQAPINTQRGVFDPESRAIIPGTEPLPKEKETPYSKGFGKNRKTGRYGYYNVRDKVEAAEYDPAPPLARPKAPGAPKPKAEKKFVSISQVRQAVEASGGKMTESDVKTKFREQGYTIVN